MNRKFFGGLVILFGLILLLNNTGTIDIGIWKFIGTYWPILLIGSGLFNIIINPVSKLAGFIVLLLGISFQLMTLEYYNIFEYNIFWPGVIIIIGISFMYSSKEKWDKKAKDSINALGLFSGYNLKNISSDFKGGSAAAIFGGIDIDLKESEIADNKKSVLDLFVAFGGIDIFVPEDWNVVIKGIPIFGGWENNNKNINSESPVLVIHSLIMFGGIEVKN